MRKAILLHRRLLMTVSHGIAILLITFLPLSTSLTASAEPCPPPATGPGVHHPVGADAGLFYYDCSGLWLSPHFSYNPATGEYAALDPLVYTYNPATGAYDYTTWVFSAPTNQYIPIVNSVSTPPAGATVVGAPNIISDTGTGSSNTINNSGAGGNTISGTGTDSDNTINAVGDNNLDGTNNTSANINNTLTAQATTGNAMVIGNTTAGGATSGNAQDIANVMNLLQSSSNALSGDMLTFVANIDGDVTGDLLLDPNMLGVQPAALNTGNTNTTLNNTVNATMNNDITLGAQSGDAAVEGNTTAGDATTGSAKAIANVVNLINSAITSGRSFLGVININGNLNGDILLPPDFLDQLIAANVPTVNIITDTGTSSDNTINNPSFNTTDITNTNNQGITNNVSAAATSGTAEVSGNTHAGNATTGAANTSITAFNLTGSNVLGRNAMLVFVNVTGKWVGLIVNAPPGTTAAGLASGVISGTGTNSNNALNSGGSNNTDIDNTANHSITNNINVAARSGNASVNDNTTGGNARSGDADAVVNLMNVQNSTLALSDWFGVLFINVFGTWNGSFGVNTSAGNALAGGMGGGAPGVTPGVFGFVPGGISPANKTHFSLPFLPGAGGTSANNNADANAAFASAFGTGPTISNPSGGSSPTASAPIDTDFNWWLLAGSGSLFFIWLAGEKLYELLAARHLTGRRLIASLRHFLF